MNESRLIALLAAAALALSAGCSREQDSSPPLENARIGGPFSLTDQDGKRVSDSDFAGPIQAESISAIPIARTYARSICS